MSTTTHRGSLGPIRARWRSAHHKSLTKCARLRQEDAPTAHGRLRMDPERFDRVARYFARSLSRRRAVQSFGALGLAAGAHAAARSQVSADCADITTCYGRGCPPENTGFCGETIIAPIPGGPVGMCWSWDAFTCNPCSTTWETLTARCNMIAGCYGQCKPAA